MSISILVTTFLDDYYLDKLLNDIIRQDYDKEKIELIIIDAGQNQEDRIKNLLSNSKIRPRYFFEKGMARTHALNKGFALANNDIIVRLDARSHIDETYLSRIEKLALEKDASVVGGVKKPIGESPKQELIAKIMSHPGLLGGAKTRRQNFEGYADTVYLGSYKRELIQNKFKFDTKYERISEDADLNYKIRKSGQKIFISNKIKVFYYPRETLIKFLKLMFGYGVSSGLFIQKNKTIKLSNGHGYEIIM